jgi:hypothetical protein
MEGRTTLQVDSFKVKPVCRIIIVIMHLLSTPYFIHTRQSMAMSTCSSPYAVTVLEENDTRTLSALQGHRSKKLNSVSYKLNRAGTYNISHQSPTTYPNTIFSTLQTLRALNNSIVNAYMII